MFTVFLTVFQQYHRISKKVTYHLISTEKYFDIRNLKKLKEFISEVKPDFIFHLAAQALVKESYINPIDSININAIGTANILDVVKDLNHDLILILITSDKAYENLEWKWGYRETDRIAGKDPYSASKSMAEIVISSYFDSFLYNKKNVKLAVARAGNVIGEEIGQRTE